MAKAFHPAAPWTDRVRSFTRAVDGFRFERCSPSCHLTFVHDFVGMSIGEIEGVPFLTVTSCGGTGGGTFSIAVSAIGEIQWMDE